MKQRTFIFIGRSGCGKGTQADLLLKTMCPDSENNCDTLHIETGALLREFVKGSNYTQGLCREKINNGELMPESVMVSLWQNHLANNFDGKLNLIFDGCPRKLHEAQLLDSAIKFYKLEKPFVVYIDVSRPWSESRLRARGRKDDTEEAIRARLDWFDTEVMPTINYYRGNSGYEFLQIDGEKTVEVVHKEILDKINTKR